MESYNSYLQHLSRLVRQTSNLADSSKNQKLITSALDGQASRAIQNLVNLETRKEYGIFFTHGNFSRQVVSPYNKRLKKGQIILDPSCGAGDLLIECSRFLPVKKTLSRTVEYWGEIIRGYDIHKQLIDAAKYRLILSAINRGVEIDCNTFNLNNIFPNLLSVDALENLKEFIYADMIVANPPYIKINAEKYGCDWSSGKVSMAGLFIDKIIENCKDGAVISAILPDVLRTGSLYRKWRKKILQNVEIRRVKSLGRFQDNVDIDVFILSSKINKSESFDWVTNVKVLEKSTEENNHSKLVGDDFYVHVGPVVPHRNKNNGSWMPYLHARDVPKWGSINADMINKKIRFDGKVYRPPFVLIRRTSSPSDKRRVVAALVEGGKNVAIENHLIVLLPKSGLLEDCVSLMRELDSDELNKFVNERNRCRHLTTSLVKSIPLMV